jgi:hypothetical protein
LIAPRVALSAWTTLCAAPSRPAVLWFTVTVADPLPARVKLRPGTTPPIALVPLVTEMPFKENAALVAAWVSDKPEAPAW